MSAQLLFGDAIEKMAELPDGCVDCVITDPPYESTRNVWDVLIPFGPLRTALSRVCPKGAFVFTAIQPFSSFMVSEWRDIFRHEWVWYKNKGTNHLNAKRAPLRYHETILVFGNESVSYNPQMTEGHKPGNYAKRVKYTSNYGAQRESEPYGGQTQRYPRSVIEMPILNNDHPMRVHPTQKPVELMAYLIKTYTNPGDTILDFAMGSGTTGVAALLEGRKFIGIEKDQKFFGHACERIIEVS